MFLIQNSKVDKFSRVIPFAEEVNRVFVNDIGTIRHFVGTCGASIGTRESFYV